METISKKIVSHILVAFVVVSCAFAFHTSFYAQGATVASGQCGDNATWVLDSNGEMTISGTGPIWDFMNDSDSYDYHPCPWLDYMHSIKKVTFSSGITYVGAGNFSEYENLEQVVFSDTITCIGNFAFSGCSKLGNFDLPQHLESIGQEAFAGNLSLTRIIIPDSVTYIDAGICSSCTNLTYVYIGGNPNASMYTMGNSPFRFCTSLGAIEVSENNIGIKSVDGVLYSKDGAHLLQYPLGKKDAAYTMLPETKLVFQFSFENALYLQNVNVPEGVEEIGNFAFSDMQELRTLTVPSTVELVGRGIAISCPKLQWIRNNSDTMVDLGYESWVDENGNPITTLEKGIAYKVTTKNGLIFNQEIGVWEYYKDDVIDYDYAGLAQASDGYWYYVENGTVNYSYTNLVLYNGVWFYVENGILNWDYTGLVLYNGAWFYVENGALNWNYTGLTCYNGTWFYVEGGVLNWGYTGLTCYNGTWFYVENGMLNWGYTGLTCYNGAWFYVENGVLNWGYTGLTYYNGAWFYVEGGVLNWGYTGLTCYNGTWFYVEGGVLNWAYTGNVYYNGVWWYVENGVVVSVA